MIHGWTAPGDRPDTQSRIVAGTQHIFSVRRKCNTVDILRIAIQHPWRAPGHRPQAHAVIPRCGGEQRSVRRNRQTRNGSGVSVEHLVGPLLTGRPDRNMRICPSSDDTSILQKCDCVHRTIVKAQYLLGGIARERPADRRCIKAARNCTRTIRRDCQRAHWSAVTAQLRVRRAHREQQHSESGTQIFNCSAHRGFHYIEAAAEISRSRVPCRAHECARVSPHRAAQQGTPAQRDVRAIYRPRENRSVRAPPAGIRGHRVSRPVR